MTRELVTHLSEYFNGLIQMALEIVMSYLENAEIFSTKALAINVVLFAL